jgi:hypothetical protein
MLGEYGAEQEADNRGHHEDGKQDVEDDHHGRHLSLLVVDRNDVNALPGASQGHEEVV